MKRDSKIKTTIRNIFKVIFFPMRILILPLTLLGAIGFWLDSDDSYWESIKSLF